MSEFLLATAGAILFTVALGLAILAAFASAAFVNSAAGDEPVANSGADR